MELVKCLREVNLIKTGKFILKSGMESNLYFDFKGIISYPKLLLDISHKLSELIDDDKKFCIAGVPIGGLSYAVMVSQIKNLPMIIIRQEKKNYGTCQQIEGNTFNYDVILLEDVITTGESVLGSIDILESNNIKIRKIICILDRECGGVERISKKGYEVVSCFKINDIIKN